MILGWFMVIPLRLGRTGWMCRESGGPDPDSILELVFPLRRFSVSPGDGQRGEWTGTVGDCGFTTLLILLMARHFLIAARTTVDVTHLRGPEHTEALSVREVPIEDIQLRRTAVDGIRASSAGSALAGFPEGFPHAVRAALVAFMAEDLAAAVFMAAAEAGANPLDLEITRKVKDVRRYTRISPA
jgi:hypothetical protein